MKEIADCSNAWTVVQAQSTGVRLAGLEPTASSFAGMRSIHLSYKRTTPNVPDTAQLPLPGERYFIEWCRRRDSNPHARFRALHSECSASTNSATSAVSHRSVPSAATTQSWWAVEGSNLGPLACEASALTTELTARRTPRVLPDSINQVLEPGIAEWGLDHLYGGNDWTRTSDLALMKRPL